MSRLSIDIPDELHRAIKSEASLRGLSLRDYVLRRLNTSNPAEPDSSKRRFSDSGLVGIWTDRDDMKDPDTWVQEQRRGRTFAHGQSGEDADPEASA
ncbi:hypothetical protein ACS8YF_18875 [Salinisphaera sp. SWV1]|uniref:hypothetical protein n=1 Tax=Salinisphaera sp. SWV1 TaxID=3454139 RepID=UPI003F85DF4E